MEGGEHLRSWACCHGRAAWSCLGRVAGSLGGGGAGQLVWALSVASRGSRQSDAPLAFPSLAVWLSPLDPERAPFPFSRIQRESRSWPLRLGRKAAFSRLLEVLGGAARAGVGARLAYSLP